MPTHHDTEPTPIPWTAKGAIVTKSNGFKIRQDRPQDRPRGAAPEAWDSIEARLEADAAFIVRAVNSHAALVAALEGLLALLGECRLDHSGNCQAHFLGNPCEVATAKAALATLKQ